MSALNTADTDPYLVHAAANKVLQITALQSQCGTLYKVVSGDGCWGIANNAKITQGQLAALNPDLNCATMGVGDGLCLFLPCATIYTVQSGEWCAKVQDEQHISAADLSSLNPGFDCSTLFAGQRLCLAAPTVPTPTSGSAPPTVPTSTPLPTYSCDQEIPITLGDTCYNLATNNSMQLSMFTTINSHLDCTTLQPGSMACVRPKCGSMYRVRSTSLQIDRV
jgi:LysM repeat protein